MKSHLARIALGAGLLTALGLSSAHAIFLWYEDFETEGNGTRYFISGGDEYYTGVHDYFTRIRDVNGFLAGGETPDIALDGSIADEYLWFSGQWYFAAANLTGSGFRVFDWPNINIDPHFDVVFDADFAAGDRAAEPAYNLHHYIAVLYSTDGGENYLPGLVFRYDGRGGARANRPLAQVSSIAPSGLHGINSLRDLGNQLATGHLVPPGDPSPDPFAYLARDGGQAASGPVLNTRMQKFVFELPNVRSVSIRLVFNMGGEQAEIAFDNLTIHGTPRVSNHPPSVVNVIGPTLAEGQSHYFSESEFDIGFRDPDPPDSLQTLRLTSLPSGGTLLNFVTGSEIDTIFTDIPRSEIGYLVYIPDPEFKGLTDSFRWYAADGAGNFAAFDAAYLLSFADENEPPVPGPDTIDRLPTGILEIPVATLLANDHDPGDDPPDLPLTVKSVNHHGGTGATVTLAGHTIFYNPNGYTGNDTFTYELEDARGAVFPGALVQVNTLHPDHPTLDPSFNPTEVNRSDGTATITARRLPGRVYRVQAADRGTPGWFDLPGGTVAADAEGRLTVVDPGPLPPARLYRTVHP